MHRFGCTHILLLGDNFYDVGVTSPDDPQWESKFRRPYRELLEEGARFYVTLGNHDYGGSVQAQIAYTSHPLNQINGYPQWNFPQLTNGHSFQTYYKQRITLTNAAPGHEEICLYSVDTVHMTESQSKWLTDQMNSDRGCNWKIVFGHYPVVTSGAHGNTGGATEQLLRPALAGANLYISGHDHNFADEGRVLASANSSQYFRQLVVGTGGASLRGTHCGSGSCCNSTCQNFVGQTFGFLSLEPTDSRLGWTFYDVNLNSISHNLETKETTVSPRKSGRSPAQITVEDDQSPSTRRPSFGRDCPIEAIEHARQYDPDVLVQLGSLARRNHPPFPAMLQRSRATAQLFFALNQRPEIIVSGQSPEAETMASLLQDAGVPSARIVLEDQSRNTIENARYSMSIIEERQWNRALIITTKVFTSNGEVDNHAYRSFHAFRRFRTNAQTTTLSALSCNAEAHVAPVIVHE